MSVEQRVARLETAVAELVELVERNMHDGRLKHEFHPEGRAALQALRDKEQTHRGDLAQGDRREELRAELAELEAA